MWFHLKQWFLLSVHFSSQIELEKCNSETFSEFQYVFQRHMSLTCHVEACVFYFTFSFEILQFSRNSLSACEDYFLIVCRRQREKRDGPENEMPRKALLFKKYCERCKLLCFIFNCELCTFFPFNPSVFHSLLSKHSLLFLLTESHKYNWEFLQKCYI